MRTGRRAASAPDAPAYKNMTDEDLKSIFAYLRTLKPIKNAVGPPSR